MKNAKTAKRKLATTLAITTAAVLTVSAPADATPNGFIQDQVGVGYFYGTFNESPNIALLVGGEAHEFCGAEDPGSAQARLFFRSDGSLDIKSNDKDQPIFLYEIDFGGVPPWLDQVCAGELAPEPFATGTADLKVRLSVLSEDSVEVFNSVNGEATATDGTEYKVRASADLVVENGVPLGNPEDFVDFAMTQIRR